MPERNSNVNSFFRKRRAKIWQYRFINTAIIPANLIVFIHIAGRSIDFSCRSGLTILSGSFFVFLQHPINRQKFEVAKQGL